MQKRSDGTISVRDKDVNLLEHDLLMMSDEIKSRFYAISVVTKLLRGPQPFGVMYIKSELAIGVEPKVCPIKLGVPFSHEIIDLNSPTFAWSTWIDDNYVMIYLECTYDLEVMYPVKCYTVDQSVVPTNITYEELDEYGLIRFLDKVLRSL